MKQKYKPKDKKTRYTILTPLFMIIFINALGTTLIFPIIAPLFSLNASNGGIISWSLSISMKNMLYGLTMAVYPFFMFIVSPLLGDFSDHVGRKKILFLCILGEGIASALSGIAIILNNFILFFLSRIIAGCMAGSLPIAQAAIIDFSSKEEKTINISLIGLAWILGFVLGPIVGGILSSKHLIPWFGFSIPFFMTTILAFCSAISLLFFVKDTFTKKNKTIEIRSIQVIKPFVMIADIFKNKAIRNIALSCLFYVLGWNAYMQFIVLYLFQKYNFTSMQIGYFVSYLAFIMSISLLLIIRVLVRYFTTIQILFFSIIISILGISIGIFNNIALQWISVIPIACGFGLVYAAINTLFSNAVSNDLQGWIMGVSASIMSIASGFGGLLVGIISSNYSLTFFLIWIIWILSFFFSLKINTFKSLKEFISFNS